MMIDKSYWKLNIESNGILFYDEQSIGTNKQDLLRLIKNTLLTTVILGIVRIVRIKY